MVHDSTDRAKGPLVFFTLNAEPREKSPVSLLKPQIRAIVALIGRAEGSVAR